MRTKKLLLTVIMALIAMTGFGQTTWPIGSPNAADVTATLDGNTLTISGTGKMQDYDNVYSESPWASYPYATQITTVKFTGSVASIGNYAFWNCTNITSVTLPQTLTSIGDYVFASCKNLTNFKIDAGNTAFSVSEGVIYNNNKTAIVYYPTGKPNSLFSIPSTVTKVSNSAFCYSYISSVFVSGNVETIGSGAFYGSGIKSIILSQSVKYINIQTFYYCTSLKNITVFWNDPSEVTLNNGTSVYDNIFYAITKSSVTLHVPSGTKALYEASNDWKDFNIVEDAVMPTINTVKFDTQGGSVVFSEDFFSGDKVLRPTNPTWEGHVFNGWYKEAACTNTWNFDTDVVTGNITLYAKWIAYCKITFDSQGGSAVASEELLPGDKITRPADPAKEGYIFRRWFKESACINAWNFNTDVVTDNLTLYAGWKTIGDNVIYYIKPDGTGDGTSWSNAAGNIQDMIDGATAGDEVWVAAGTYYPTTQTSTGENSKTFLMKDGVNLYGGFVGNETSVNNRIQSDVDNNGKVETWEFTNETILSGKLSESNQCSHVVTLGDPDAFLIETLFDGFTVTEGSCGIYASGKGIINNCLVVNNIGSIGGGIVNGSEGTVSNCKVTNNSDHRGTGSTTQTCYILNGRQSCIPYTYTASGGGIYNSGTVINCVVTNNSAIINDNNNVTSYTKGGGIYNNGGRIINCSVTGNSSQTLYGCNYPHYAEGGGIYNDSGVVINCFVADNSCNVISLSTYTPNHGEAWYSLGGGIYNLFGSVNSCCVTNNRVNGDTSYPPVYKRGGGIYNYGSSSSNAVIYCSTILKNTPENIYTYDDGTDFAYNCIIDNSDMTQFINPGMSDYHLISGSKYIDAGSLDNIPDWIKTGTDLAGNPRTHDGKISMGAYEYDPSYVGTDTGTDTGTGTGTDTGIHELQQQAGIAVSPNPATDFVSVSGLQGNETLYFYNINGQLLITRKASGETENIPVGNLPSGIYLLKTSNGQIVKWVKR